MVLYDITLFIYRQENYITVSSRSVFVKVLIDRQYDNLSKRIKKYTQIIDYQERIYKASNYHITVYDRNALYYKNILKYYCPEKKVLSIDLFFNSSDKNNTHPLVIGVNQENESTVYYTYDFLIYYTAPKILFYHFFTQLPDRSNSFGKEDLITRLIEESDKLLKKTDGKRMVIMLNSRPSDENKDNKYPKTGPNKDRISISKLTLLEKYFDKYEHKISTEWSQKNYYLCYDQNTLYILHDKDFNDIKSVDVYYNQFYGQEPIIIVLKSNSKNKLYKYLDFKSDLEKSDLNKDTSSLEDINEGDVEIKLKEENDRINPYWPYLIDKLTDYSYQVKVEKAREESESSEFTKYTHTPQNGYSYEKSLFLYKGEKLKKKVGNKFEPIEEIQNIVYKCVTVYFGTRDTNIPLIIQLNKSEHTNNNEYYAHNKDDVSYWEKLSIKSSYPNNDLLKKLKETESNLFDSILLLVDFNKKYDKDEIQDKTGVKFSGSQTNSIEVFEDKSLLCLNNTNYKCYKHDLSVETKLYLSDIDNVKLKLFLGNKTYSHSEITLYGSDDPSDFNREYIYYGGKNKEFFNFYVIFYCENNVMDPRPVLLCYQSKVYRPLSLEDYNTKWICVKGVKINSDTSTDSKLLETLRKVSYSMNPVNIGETTDRKIGKLNTVYRYTTHIFNSSTLIQITIKPKDLNCYRKYTHTPTEGYVLGEVIHNGSKLFVNYEQYVESIAKKNTFPYDINVYYYMYDKGHNYPLLVSLSYYGTRPNYFKLTSKNNPLKWVLITQTYELDLIKNNIEQFLYNTRYNLGIQYENKDDNLIIESADKCNERSNVGVIVGVISTIALVAGGVAGAFYKFPEFFHSIYSRIG